MKKYFENTGYTRKRRFSRQNNIATPIFSSLKICALKNWIFKKKDFLKNTPEWPQNYYKRHIPGRPAPGSALTNRLKRGRERQPGAVTPPPAHGLGHLSKISVSLGMVYVPLTASSSLTKIDWHLIPTAKLLRITSSITYKKFLQCRGGDLIQTHSESLRRKYEALSRKIAERKAHAPS